MTAGSDRYGAAQEPEKAASTMVGVQPQMGSATPQSGSACGPVRRDRAPHLQQRFESFSPCQKTAHPRAFPTLEA